MTHAADDSNVKRNGTGTETGTLDLKVQVSETAVGQSHGAQFFLQDMDVGTGLLPLVDHENSINGSADVREQQVITAIRELIADENRRADYDAGGSTGDRQRL